MGLCERGIGRVRRERGSVGDREGDGEGVEGGALVLVVVSSAIQVGYTCCCLTGFYSILTL